MCLMNADSSKMAENKALIRQWFEEVWNQGRENRIDELRAPDTVATGLGESHEAAKGPDPFKAFYSNVRRALPDLHVTIEDMLAEGDKVAARLFVKGTHTGDGLGATPTGRRVSFTAMTIARIAGGRIAEAWNSIDQLALLTQIGALPKNDGPDRFLTTP